MKRVLAMTLAVALRAHAGTGTWLCEITTPDGDSIVEPGETAVIRLSLDFTPRPTEFDAALDAEILGFADVAWDMRGGSEWSSGRASWYLNPDLYSRFQEPTLDGMTQDIFDLQSGQFYTTGGAFTPADPIWVGDVLWDPTGDYSRRTVEVLVDTRKPYLGGGTDPEDTIGVWAMPRGELGEIHADYSAPDVQVAFEVIPSPGAILPLVAAGVFAASRRR